jgi:hypothetical protein
MQNESRRILDTETRQRTKSVAGVPSETNGDQETLDQGTELPHDTSPVALMVARAQQLYSLPTVTMEVLKLTANEHATVVRVGVRHPYSRFTDRHHQVTRQLHRHPIHQGIRMPAKDLPEMRIKCL